MTDPDFWGATARAPLERLRAAAESHLVENWDQVLRRAWSVRLIVLAAALSGLEVVIQVITALSIATPIPPGIFAALSGLVSAGAFVARIVAQKKDPDA